MHMAGGCSPGGTVLIFRAQVPGSILSTGLTAPPPQKEKKSD